MNDDMPIAGGGPGPGRNNGLPAPAWVPVCDVDPRLGAPLLEALRDADIPAYVAGSTGTTGPYGERLLPDRPTDRLWVDARMRGEAERLVSSTLPNLQESLEDERWAQIVASLSSEERAASGEWPEVEGRASTTTSYEPEPEILPPVDDEGHFIPPDPPPPPPAHPITRYGWTALLGGLALLLVPAMLGSTVGSGLMLLAIAAMAGGFLTLVVRMKDSPPVDDGPDDGAVV